ncbi:MAG: phosphomannomutase [Candidatus Competibacterales bacterium]
MVQPLSCFKAYDIRGQVPQQLDEDIARRIGLAFAAEFAPQAVAVGRDIRLTSPSLCQALADGLMAGGVDVVDIGLCGTEEVYFAAFHGELGGGIMVTASHNPADYNGMKLVRERARPISGDSGLPALKTRAEADDLPVAAQRGSYSRQEDKTAYIQHLLSYTDPAQLKPLKVVANAGNGGAGLIIDRLQDALPLEFVKLHFEPDGRFPNGIPNPLLPENRQATAEAVVAAKADLGIAWDGDFDRCFFFDEQGRFIEGYYLVGLLAEAALDLHPGAAIVHDPRLVWNTIDLVEAKGGRPVQSKTGHAFIKERMRLEDAAYGGEMSAHHYFRDFAYCDSGMIPWLLIVERMAKTGRSLSSLVDERIRAYPCSGELNFRLDDPKATLAAVAAHYQGQNPAEDTTDGLSLTFADWRFNLRASNTEPLVRLNVETRGDGELLARRTAELRQLLES